MDRRVTSPTRGPPPPCKQALKQLLFVFLLMRNNIVNGGVYFLLLGVMCHMPSKSIIIVPKSWVSELLSALHIKVLHKFIYFLQISEIW